MSKRFNIHEWQAKQKRLAENDEYQKRQDAQTPGKNPEYFYDKDSIFAKLKKDPDYIKKLNAKKEHHNDEDFPGKDLSAWDLLDKLKSGDKELYDRVEDFMKSMKEMSMTGGGASFGAGNSMAHLGKKNKRK